MPQLSKTERTQLEAQARAHLGAHRPAEAAALFAKLTAATPSDAGYAFDLALALLTIGASDDALAACERAAALAPRSAEAAYLVGNCLAAREQGLAAIAHFRRAISLRADFADAYNSLGNTLLALADLANARVAFEAAIGIAPAHGVARCNLGRVFHAERKFDTAIATYREALALSPNLAALHNNLGASLREVGLLGGAAQSFERALQLDPHAIDTLSNYAACARDLGQHARALELYRTALGRAAQPVVHSNYLLALLYNPSLTVAQILEEHRGWNARYARPVARTFSQSHDPARPIKLGFVSPDFGRHPVGYFLAGLFAQIDRSAFKLFCYSDRGTADELTDRLRANSDTWLDSKLLSDGALADRIAADEIDLLFDLAGHTANNRLVMFAQRAAPIQLTWLGYAFSTGVAAMDAIVSDANETPAGVEANFTEQIIRLPHGYLCYEPPGDAPAVSPLPALRNGHLTFGSFNHLAKMNEQVFALWCDLLAAIPSARLILKTKELNEEAIRNGVRGLFVARGIDGARIDLRGSSPHRELLATYGEIDVALDPFPYSGGLTTCEAVWMGVPVLTLGGDRFCSRHSISHLKNVGLHDFVVDSPAAYIARARAVAADVPTLVSLRANLREQCAPSPLFDAAIFTRGFERAMRERFTNWCKS